MNTIEEQLWNYIDGNCTPVERLEIEQKLAVNIQYYTLYQELIKVNEELSRIDFEEPSMSFSRMVMDKVKLESKPIALQTKVDNRIVYSIAGFFLLTLSAILIYSFASSDLGFKFDTTKVHFSLGFSKFLDSIPMQVFLFIGMTIALVYLDGLWRKGKFARLG